MRLLDGRCGHWQQPPHVGLAAWAAAAARHEPCTHIAGMPTIAWPHQLSSILSCCSALQAGRRCPSWTRWSRLRMLCGRCGRMQTGGPLRRGSRCDLEACFARCAGRHAEMHADNSVPRDAPAGHTSYNIMALVKLFVLALCCRSGGPGCGACRCAWCAAACSPAWWMLAPCWSARCFCRRRATRT